MPTAKPSIILPIENQVRELDPKLLLACIAAERGFITLLGYRTQLDFRVQRLARSTYLSKGMTPKSARMFRILRQLGHEIAVWDEEALVYLSPDHYYARRMSPESLPYVSLLFAWSVDNEEMYRNYSHYQGTPIHITGNPRIDLLRPELHSYFDKETAAIRERHGSFVLVNTNFSMTNGFLDSLNLFRKASEPGAERELGAAGKGMSREFSAGYAAHKEAIFSAFVAMLPVLGRSFPDRRFIVRPHPSEDPDPWHEAASACENVAVVQEGNVIPWLLAADALIHNGCTTSVEAFALGLPSIAYRPVRSETYDFDLPNSLSHQSADENELIDVLGRLLRGQLGCLESPPTPRPLGEHLSALSGPLSCDRIVDVLERREATRARLPRPAVADFARGWITATKRSFVKQRIKARIPGHRNNPEFQAHRFPGVSLGELRDRIARFDKALGRFGKVEVQRITDHIFKIY